MKKLFQCSAAAAALCGLACMTAAHAQPAGGDAGRAEKLMTEFHKRFGAADTNTDGKLTREEANGKMPWVAKNFDAIDTAHAGFVTAAQIQAYALSQRGGRKAP